MTHDLLNAISRTRKWVGMFLMSPTFADGEFAEEIRNHGSSV